METITHFFEENLVAVFFLYGASFYALSFAIIFGIKSLKDLNIARPFLFLVLFGFTHGTVEMMDALSIFRLKTFNVAETYFYSMSKVGLLCLSFVFLLIFAIRLLFVVRLKSGKIETYLSVIIPLLAAVHFGISFFSGAPVSISDFDATVRYFIALPSAFISAVGMYLLSRDKGLMIKLPSGAEKSLRICASMFLTYGIFAGLIVPESDYLFASSLNYNTFLANVGIPVQLFRMVSALSIAYFFVRAMALSLATKFWCAYGVIIVTIVTIGISDFIVVNGVIKAEGNITKLHLEEEHIYNLNVTFTKIGRYLYAGMKIDENIKGNFEKELNYLKGIEHREEKEEILLNKIDEGYRKLLNMLQDSLPKDEKAYLLIEEINDNIDAVSRMHRNEILLHLNKINRSSKHAFYTHIIGFIVAFFVFLFVGYRFIKMILVPLITIKHGMIETGKGNLKYRIELNTRDELQEIAEEYNRMTRALLDRNQMLEKAKDEMERLAITDGMTELFNYRYFYTTLESEIERAKRYDTTLSLLMLDIDDFKHYNDTHGHLMGDEVLRHIATLFKDSLRKVDIPCRYGGEEFAIILPAIDKENAINVAEKIRKAIEVYTFPFEDAQPGGKLTVSIGIANYPADAKGHEELIKKADDALYTSKVIGKNRVYMA